MRLRSFIESAIKVKIYFTDQPVLMKIAGLKNFTLTIPEECKELGFCEHIPNYPQDYVSEIITLVSVNNN